jgi:hypothetical protein
MLRLMRYSYHRILSDLLLAEGLSRTILASTPCPTMKGGRLRLATLSAVARPIIS